MAKNSAPPTQDNLPIAGIQDGVIIMNDSSVRAVLQVEPINFELKSDTEQNSIIYGYQSFLNSLEFPVQIVIHSKKLDLEHYLLRLEKSKESLNNDLLRIQIEDYVDFVRRLISVANIMSKRFYAIVSYGLGTASGSGSIFSNLFHHKPTGPLLDQDQFERFRNEVLNRGNTIAAGLTRLGLKVNTLDTQQLIELFYGIYNPDIATEERLTDVEKISPGVVSAISPATATPEVAPATETPAAATPPEPAKPEEEAAPAVESIGVQPPPPVAEKPANAVDDTVSPLVANDEVEEAQPNPPA